MLLGFFQKINLALCCSIILTACTHGVLSFPPASINYYENENKTGRAVRVETWGIAIDTNMDSGLSIGHVVKTYFYEGENSQQIGNMVNQNNAQLMEIIDSKNGEVNDSSPYAYVVMSQGLMFNTNTQRLGFAVGANVYERIYLPLDFDGVLLINSKIDSKNPGEFYIKRGGS